MRRTTVYLDEADIQALRSLSAATGRSQADLIREAIRDATRQAHASRKFHSLGQGQGPGGPTPHWAAAKLYESRLPGRPTD